MGDAGPNAVYRLVQREMGMAISGFKGKIKKKFLFHPAPVKRKRVSQSLFLMTGCPVTPLFACQRKGSHYQLWVTPGRTRFTG
jgi:hypothetical protein